MCCVVVIGSRRGTGVPPFWVLEHLIRVSITTQHFRTATYDPSRDKRQEGVECPADEVFAFPDNVQSQVMSCVDHPI